MPLSDSARICIICTQDSNHYPHHVILYRPSAMSKLVATWKTCLLLLLWTPQIISSALIARGGAIMMMILYRSISDDFLRIDLFLSYLPGAIMMMILYIFICFWLFCKFWSLSILFAQVCRGSRRSSHSQVQGHQEQQEALILVFAKPLKPLNQVVFAEMSLEFWTNRHHHHQVQRHQEQQEVLIVRLL